MAKPATSLPIDESDDKGKSCHHSHSYIDAYKVNKLKTSMTFRRIYHEAWTRQRPW